MTADDSVREDIAFIRRAIEQGRGYAAGRSLDMLVWGIAVAIGYLATYATVAGWWRVHPNWVWTLCIVLPWLYSLRRVLATLLLRSPPRPIRPPLVQAMRMLWFGCGIFLSTFAVAVIMTREMRQGWFNAVSAGILGIGFFASSHLRKLEDAGYVSVQKRFVERKPQTRYALTERGRKALLDHVAHLETLLRRKKSTGEKGK